VVTFNPFDPRYQADGVPWDLLAEARRSSPVCPMPQGGYLLARQEEVLTALKDIEAFRADLAHGLDVPSDELFLSEIPEPRHGSVRRLYNAHLGPHRIGNLQPYVRALCNDLLDSILARGETELVGDYTDPIPARVVAQLIGVPTEDADTFVEWGNTLHDRAADREARNEDGPPPIYAYIQELLRRRREMVDPPDDVVSHLMNAEVDGEPLSDTEIRTQLHFIVLAGVGTTRVLLGNLIYRLMMSAELYEQVRADRRLVPRLVEESLRHDAPVQTTPRRCLRPTVLDGVKVDEGEWVIMGLGSANCDERVYPDPQVFRLDRSDPRNHMAFGAGPHVCPGASLARMEAVNAIDVLMDRVRGLSPLDGFDYDPVPNLSLVCPRALPATLHPA
jgi:cytochrome P450